MTKQQPTDSGRKISNRRANKTIHSGRGKKYKTVVKKLFAKLLALHNEVGDTLDLRTVYTEYNTW